MNKKGYIKTLEAVIAVVGTFFFILIIIPERTHYSDPENSVNLLSILSQNDDFRDCIVEYNNTCVESFIKQNFDHEYYNYTFNISNSFDITATIDRDDIYSKSLFISGNKSIYSPRVLRMYYWVE